MEPSSELLKQLREEDLAAARMMTLEQRLRAGAELFDAACRFTLAGIRHQHPEYDETQALDELRRRIADARQREDVF